MKNRYRFILLLWLTLMATTTHGAVLKFSTAYPDGAFAVKALKAAAEEVEAKTAGRVKLKVYPGGVQGDNKTVLKKIKRGILEGCMMEGGALADDFKDGQVYNAPMAFRDFDEVNYVRKRMDAELIRGFAEAGWKMFGLIDGGFAYAMTSRPVSSIAGLKQQKLWLPANDPVSENIAKALNLSPIYLGLGEVLTALQTGAIDAIAAPPAAALTLQWYSKLKYVTDAPFIYTYAAVAVSDKAFGKLSAADQKVVSEILTRAVADIDKRSRADNLKAFEALSSQGLVLVTPTPEEAKVLQAQAEKATAYMVEQGEFTAARLAKLNALLAEARGRSK